MKRNIEEIKNQAIQDVLAKINEQIKKEGRIVGNMNLDKISTIEKNEEGRIILMYPLENPNAVGAPSDYAKVIVYPDGLVKIMGCQTDKEKRAGETDTYNGAYEVKMKLDNWKESDAVKEVIKSGYGKDGLNNELGVLEKADVKSVEVDEKNVRDGIDKMLRRKPISVHDKVEPLNIERTYGYDLPNAPVVEEYDDGMRLLIVTPGQAAKILKDSMYQNPENTTLYTNCDIGEEYLRDIQLGYMKVYIVNSNDIKQDEEKTKQENEEYKKTVLYGLKNGLNVDFRLISKELLEDKEFVKEAIKYEPKITRMISQEMSKDEDVIEGLKENKKLDYYDIYHMNPDASDVMLDDILGGLSDEEYESLELDEDTSVEMSSMTCIEENEKGEQVEEKGMLIRTCEIEYPDPEEEYAGTQTYYSAVGIFVPINNFKDARIVYMSGKDREEGKYQEFVDNCLKPMLREIKELPYENASELLMRCKEREQENEYDIDDIEETVSDRTITELNKTVEDIKEEKQEDKKKKVNKDIVED